MTFNKQIVVIGSSKANKKLYKTALEVGREIAKNKHILVCGGKEGVMEAVCKGAKENNGVTIGITPDLTGKEGNKYLDIVIPTGMGYSRNYIVQSSANVIIMIGGSYGTLSELAYALQHNKKVISLKSSWSNIDKKIIKAKNPKDAVQRAVKFLNG